MYLDKQVVKAWLYENGSLYHNGSTPIPDPAKLELCFASSYYCLSVPRNYLYLQVAFRVIKEALPTKLTTLCYNRDFIAVLFKKDPIRHFFKILICVFVKEPCTYGDRLADVSYYWRVELDKEACLLAFRIGWRRLVSAVRKHVRQRRSEKHHGSKRKCNNHQRSKTQNFFSLNSTPHFSKIKIKIAPQYILVISCTRAGARLQILLISIRSTDEQFCRMGSLAWLGYLSYTQVVESSNLSPSILSLYCSLYASCFKVHLVVSHPK